MSYAYNYIRSLRIFTLMKLHSQFNILLIKYQQFEENQCLKRQLSQYSYFIWKPPIISVFFNFTHHTNLHNIKACVQIYILSRILAIYRFILEHWVYSKLCQDINRKILSFLPLLPFSVKSIFTFLLILMIKSPDLEDYMYYCVYKQPKSGYVLQKAFMVSQT